MPGEECFCKIDQVRDDMVLCVCPEAGEFKAVAGLFLLLSAGIRILNGIKAGAVGVVFGVGPVTDYKNLYILKKPGSRPE